MTDEGIALYISNAYDSVNSRPALDFLTLLPGEVTLELPLRQGRGRIQIRSGLQHLLHPVVDQVHVFRIVDGRARLTKVAIGDGDDRFRVVTSGVSAGDQLVLFPGDTLHDGDAVQVLSR